MTRVPRLLFAQGRQRLRYVKYWEKPIFYISRTADGPGAKSYLWNSCHHSCDFTLQAHYHGRQIVALVVDRFGAYIHLAHLGRCYPLQSRLAFDFPDGAWNFSWLFFAGLGQATVQTIYTYLGYYNVCHLGGEVKTPEKNIPRSIFISIFGIAILYLAMQLSIFGVVP